jgi:hypothetical protein
MFFAKKRPELLTLGTFPEDLPNGQRSARSALELTFRQMLVAVDFANQEIMKMIGRPGGKELDMGIPNAHFNAM